MSLINVSAWLASPISMSLPAEVLTRKGVQEGKGTWLSAEGASMVAADATVRLWALHDRWLGLWRTHCIQNSSGVRI